MALARLDQGHTLITPNMSGYTSEMSELVQAKEIWAYVAHSPRMKLHKIGSSGNIDGRMSDLACGCPDIYVVDYFSGGQPLEKYLQKVFARYRFDREWFELPVDWPDRVQHAITSYRTGLPPSRADRSYELWRSRLSTSTFVSRESLL